MKTYLDVCGLMLQEKRVEGLVPVDKLLRGKAGCGSGRDGCLHWKGGMG